MKKDITIFYADDDEDDLSFFKMATSELSCDVRLFSNGTDLLEQIKNPPPVPQVVFLDINMPHRNGLQILQDIRESDYPDTQVIIFSTASSDASIEQMKKLGANYYLIKPTSVLVLEKALKEIVDMTITETKFSDTAFVLNF